MTKLADLTVLTGDQVVVPASTGRDGKLTRRPDTRPVTVDDLVEVLADPEVQEALGAVGVWPHYDPTNYDKPSVSTRHFKAPAKTQEGYPYLVVPLSRLEDTK